jgi:putative oxidoreductase
MGLPYWLGYVSAYAEFIGGILLILGLLTRLSATFVAINMFFAFFLFNIHRGLGSFDYSLAFAAIAVMLLFYGGGALALDRKIGFA